MRAAVALTVLLAFGCATIRQPSGSVDGAIGPSDQVWAEPQIELWLESGEPVSPAETAAAREQAREALEQALQSRAIAPSPLGASDPVLVVRERGISRTASRKRDQVAATVGLVVGAVVVVAVVIALAVSSKSSPKASAPKSAPAPATPAAPVARAAPLPHARPVAPPPPPIPVATASHFPQPWPYVGHPWLWLDVGFYLPPQPLVLRPAEAFDAPPAPEPAEDPAPAEPPPLELPPPPSLDVSERGFFSGDDSVLQLDLLDRATGQLLWSKTVQGGDPRDPGDVRRMVSEALDSVSWAPRVRARQ